MAHKTHSQRLDAACDQLRQVAGQLDDLQLAVDTFIESQPEFSDKVSKAETVTDDLEMASRQLTQMRGELLTIDFDF